MPASAHELSTRAGFTLRSAPRSSETFAGDVRTGLSAAPKSLPPRWFYDDLGSALFDAICFLPEYYVLRAEREVLTTHQTAIAAALGTDVRLIELGSGTARKTRILMAALANMNAQFEYAPIDIDGGMLTRLGGELQIEYPDLPVRAISGDFTSPRPLLALLPPHSGRTAVLFLGSTIGNFDPEASVALLRDIRSALRPGDVLLLGVDLRKSRAILEPAYDDALGVTAAFNLNVLARINRELGGHFDLASFRHRAFYDEALGRIEMHVVSSRAQRIAIDALDLEVAFADGETIHTESSYKHDATTVRNLADECGFEVAQTWTDSRGWFADVLLRVAGSPASSTPQSGGPR